MTATTPADIDAIVKRLKCHLGQSTKNIYDVYEADTKALLAAIRDRDATIERLTKEAAIWDAQAGARHADVTALQAEVASLTAERDEAAVKERERCVAVLKAELADWLEDAKNAANRHDWHRASMSSAVVRVLDEAADAIARGEPQGENDA